ncbi:virulence factor [Kaustia mangrovi]|uniref:Virulence factor n=1 Tax=Kaustia mangrovi TaxID=2593653 RepID=A0A7S8C6U2_9HYPH|nr:virulence factor [Kaustia mangrovi]QPC44439.1 virulence factor [Kaustia mangrovi]
MADVVVVFWRDIPAQVIVRSGRKCERRQLSDRFQEAIDMAAMRGGAAGTDAYLDEWRRAAAEPCGDDLAAEADRIAGTFEAAFDKPRLKNLADNGGWARPN